MYTAFIAILVNSTLRLYLPRKIICIVLLLALLLRMLSKCFYYALNGNQRWTRNRGWIQLHIFVWLAFSRTVREHGNHNSVSNKLIYHLFHSHIHITSSCCSLYHAHLLNNMMIWRIYHHTVTHTYWCIYWGIIAAKALLKSIILCTYWRNLPEVEVSKYN